MKLKDLKEAIEKLPFLILLPILCIIIFGILVYWGYKAFSS